MSPQCSSMLILLTKCQVKKIFASFLCSEVYLLDEVRCNSSLKVDSLMSCFCQCWLIFIDYTEGVFYGRYFGTI
jgi:hypothetical protein